MAVRLCRCGAVLLEVGARVCCRRCGSSCGIWLVATDTGLVAVASEAEMVPGAELRDGLRYAARITWGRAD